MQYWIRSRWVMIAIGFVIDLVLGLLYAWSVFVLPLEREFGWVRAQTSLAFTASLVFFPLGQIIGGRMIDWRDIRFSGSIAAMLLTVGFLLASFTSSIPWLVVSYGVVAGFAIGMGANTTANVVSWFPDKRGLAAGALTMGFGLAGLVLGSLTNQVIEAIGWRSAFRILAGVSVVICFGGYQFLRKAPPGFSPPGSSPTGPIPTESAQGAINYTPTEMLRSGTFWAIEIWFLLLSTAGLMMIGHIVPMAVELGIGQATAVVAMGVLSLANGLGRPLYGILSDRLGRVPTMFLSGLLMGLAIFFAIPAAKAMGSWGLLMAVLVVGACYGGGIPQSAAMTMQFFGTRYFGTNLGINSSQVAIAGILGPQMAGLVRTETGAYDLAFQIAAGMALMACFVAILFGLRQHREARTSEGARPA